MGFVLGLRSRQNLSGVHHHLRQIVERAIQITKVDFTVIEGVRNIERQRQLVAQKLSRTMNSRHLTGHAVDLAAWVDGTIDWDNYDNYKEIGRAMRQAAKELGYPIRWGADWDSDGDHKDETFLDWVHFELPRGKDYP